MKAFKKIISFIFYRDKHKGKLPAEIQVGAAPPCASPFIFNPALSYG